MKHPRRAILLATCVLAGIAVALTLIILNDGRTSETPTTARPSEEVRETTTEPAAEVERTPSAQEEDAPILLANEPPGRTCDEYAVETRHAYAAYASVQEHGLEAYEPPIASAANYRMALQQTIYDLIPHETHGHGYLGDSGNPVGQLVDVLDYLNITPSEYEAYHKCPEEPWGPHNHP